MEENFEYEFKNGLQLKIVLGEDGYNVNIWGIGKPLMGTFTDFKHLLNGIGHIILLNTADEKELDDFAAKLDLALSNVYVIDEIRELLEDL